MQAVYYQQSCPTCGRSLRIRVVYLGRKLYCQHCHGAFTAAESFDGTAASDSGIALLQRAEELLAMAERKNAPQQLD
jgi:hypothetical protein